MSAYRIKIDTELLNIVLDFAKSLHAIGVEENHLPCIAALTHNLGNFSNWLNRPDFVVRLHNGYKHRLGTQVSPNVVYVN